MGQSRTGGHEQGYQDRHRHDRRLGDPLDCTGSQHRLGRWRLMFEERSLPPALSSIRDDHAPEAFVLDCERDFETLKPAVAEELGLLVEGLDPVSYPTEWLPADAPEILAHYASGEFTIGAPGDGGVAWTRQTDPPVVFVKPRLEGAPESFIDFLIAEALVELGLDVPEHFLGFFEGRYRDLAAAAEGRLDSAETYQLAGALTSAYVGLHTRPVFESWDDDYPALSTAYVDAGERLEPRLADLSSDVARGSTAFGDAAELACSAIKHGVEIPTPFAALDTSAYRGHGTDFAVKWAERVLE